MKSVSEINYFLGMEILRVKHGFIMNQRKFALDLLQEFDCSGAQVSSPLDPYSKLVADDGPLLSNPTIYRHLVGKLNYLTYTRPDLSFVVFILSQFMRQPRESYFFAALRVLWYLHTDPGQGIRLSSDPLFELMAFCDADWASCWDSCRSISGYFITLGGAPVS